MILKFEDQIKAIKAEADKFPKEFGLAAFPGRVFQISEGASYYSDASGVMLYAYVKKEDGSWESFAKGTPAELRREMVNL